MAVLLSPVGGVAAQFFTNAGVPLSGGKIYTYAAGTSTPQATYTTGAGNIQHSNPIVLDAAGRVPTGEIWLVDGASYKFVIKDANFVLIGTYDNISGINPQLYANNILYTYPATGAIQETVQTKLSQYVSVKDFGAVGNGIADDTIAIQNAINALVATGGILKFPSGTYKITSTLNYVSTVNTNLSGISFVGDGKDTTVLLSYVSSGPLLNIQGTKTHSSGGTGSLFINGGGIYGIKFDGTHSSGTADAINILGWQYATIDNCYIGSFPRDGIRQLSDSGYPNADYTASIVNVNNTWIYDCAAYGINQTTPIGSPSWTFNKSLFLYCGTAAYITSSGNAFYDCSFSGSGFSPSNAVRGIGKHLLIGQSSISINEITLQRNEFDYARIAHISLDYVNTTYLQQNRFIFNDRSSTGSLTPTNAAVELAYSSGSSAVHEITIDSNTVRIDGPGTANGYALGNIANVSNLSLTNNIFQNNGGATLNKYVGFTASNYNQRQNYYVYDAASDIVIPGTPAPEYIGNCTSSTMPNAGIIVFGTQDSLNYSIFTNTLYNTTTGVYTVNNAGYYDVNFSVAVVSATTSEYYQIDIRKNGSAIIEFDYSGNGLARTSMTGYTRTFCNVGDTIDIYNNGANGKSITGGYSQLVIKMVK